MDERIWWLIGGWLALMSCGYLGWQLGARRTPDKQRERGKTGPPTETLWLCEACHSFNEAEREVCYRCREPRAPDARTVVPDAVFHVDQRFGSAKQSESRGPSGVWAGGDEPLRDAWLAAQPPAGQPPIGQPPIGQPQGGRPPTEQRQAAEPAAPTADPPADAATER